MNYATSSLKTRDGLTLHTASWQPTAAPRAVVILVHGYGEHHGRYTHVGSFLAEQGYAVYTLDHRGHGKSEGLRAYVDSFDQFIENLHEYVEQVKKVHPGLKVFVMGHSMGALISLTYCLRHPEGIAGLVTSGAPVNADANVSPLLVAAGTVLTQIIPKVPFLTFGSNDILSRDPEVVRAFETDPLTWKQPMRVRLGTEINRASRWAREHLPQLKMPYLVLHGGDDAFVNPSGSEVAYKTAGSGDKTLKIYPGLRHEIMNEPEKAEVLADIAAWLRQRTG